MSDLGKEREIPVFTVLKNNSILKNIFLINKNQENDDNEAENYPEFEEILLVGRHPDCDIKLEHPSVSRFHLKITSLPSFKQLFITDLSSVHGTWVSDRRIERNIRTIVKEGDDLRIGASSRVYKLHWVPLSQAYDVSKPFVPPLDFLKQQDEEDEISKDEVLVGMNDEGMHDVNNIYDDNSKDPCGDDQMVVERALPHVNPASVINEATEQTDTNFEGLESLHLDAVSPILNNDFENKDVQSGDFIIEEGLVSLFEGDISEDLGQKEMLLAPLILNEDLENEDAQSVDSVLEGLVPLFMGENWEWIGMEDNCLPCPTEEDDGQSSKKTFFLDENSELSAPLLPEEMKFCTAENMDNTNSDRKHQVGMEENYLPCLTGEDYPPSCNDDETGHAAPVLEGLNTLSSDIDSEFSAPLMPEVMEFPVVEDMDTINSEGRQWVGTEENYPSFLFEDDETGLVSPVLKGLNTFFLAENSELSAPLMPGEVDFSEANMDNTTDEGRHEFVPEMLGENIHENGWSFWCGSLVAPSSSATIGSLLNIECQHPSIEYENTDHEGDLWSFWSGKMGIESVCSAFSDVDSFPESENKSMRNSYVSSLSSLVASDQKSDIGYSSESEKESSGDGCHTYQSPKSFSSVKGRLGTPLMTSDQNPVDSIWSRRSKMIRDQEYFEDESISRALFHRKNNQEEEVFTPDKENVTPVTHKSTRKLAALKDISNSSSRKSPFLKMACSPNKLYDDIISPFSNKENHSPGSHQKKNAPWRASANRVQSVKLKERKEVRMPFQSLLADSPQKNIADTETKSGSCVGCANVITFKGKRASHELHQWNIIVDTSTLLNKESRKALQLLEGLKGTRLIIPRIVITELASLKQQVSFFRSNTEVLSALEWIQDCILRTGWWVHVQNSTEEGRGSVEPTAPSPHSQFSCGIIGSYAFSWFESQREVLSPTVEDGVLDFALDFRKSNSDGQLVLLSNHISMKIKAMAEGVICETGDEFRASLVNPFSDRFLWSNSSPRGQTWSCADDFVLMKKFYPSSLKMTSKSMENVKGLKLILLHDSRCHGQITAIN